MQTDPRVTDAVLTAEHRELLEAELFSFERLELLHALRAAAGALSSRELEDTCRLDADTVASVLAELAATGLVIFDQPGKRASLGAAANAPTCESLLALYAQDRALVLAALAPISLRRIRSMAARTFSDAFILRKKRED